MDDVDVILEVPESWLENPLDGAVHQRLYASLLVALARLSATVRPVVLPFGADDADRLYRNDQLVISFHSRGPAGNVLRIKESYVRPYYTFDALGYSGFSELGRDPEAFLDEINRYPLEKAAQLVEATRRDLTDRNLSKYPQPQRGTRQVPYDHIFMPLQTEEDPVAALSMLDQIDVARSVAEYGAMLGKDVLVKRHPFCQSRRIETALTELERSYENFQVVNSSVHELNETAECVVGCNSGALFEALIVGTRVVSFGRSDFQLATTAVSGLDDLPGAIIGRGVVDREFTLRFLGWYLDSYCVRASDTDEIENRIGIALANLDIRKSRKNARQEQLFDFFSRKERQRRNRVLGSE